MHVPMPTSAVRVRRAVRMAPAFADEGKLDNPMHTSAGQMCTDMTKSRVVSDPPIPSTWERFTVVDGGTNGTVAFYSPYHRRFIRMPPALGHVDVSDVRLSPVLPDQWIWERFELIPASNRPSEVGLFSTAHARFVRMSSDAAYLESSAPVTNAALPADWASERFRILLLADSPPPSLPPTPPPTTPPPPSAPGTCPLFSPEAVLLLCGMGVVTLAALSVAVGAVACALKKHKAAAKLSAPVPMNMVPLQHIAPPPAAAPAPHTEAL